VRIKWLKNIEISGFTGMRDFDKLSDILDKNSGKLNVFYYLLALMR